MKNRLLAVLFLVAALIGPSWSESQNIISNHQDKTYTMQAGDSLNVVGNHNTILVLGAAGSVEMIGNHNQITIDADLPQVNVLGNNNTIFLVERPGRTLPSVSNLGHDNKVEKLVPTP